MFAQIVFLSTVFVCLDFVEQKDELPSIKENVFKIKMSDEIKRSDNLVFRVGNMKYMIGNFMLG